MARRTVTEAVTDEGELEMQFTPLIDVVFLLLVFFLTSINFRTTEGFLQANIPPAAPPIKLQKDDTVTILLDDRTQRLVIKVNTVVMTGSTHVELFDSLAGQLLSVKQAYTRSGEKMPLVVIDASGTLLYKYVIAALNVCGKLKIDNISFVLPD